jgi:hypothetical protein
MSTLAHTIPRSNWPMTDRYLKSLDYIEGRDYTFVVTKDTVTLTFSYSFQYTRYWDQWGKHIEPV